MKEKLKSEQVEKATSFFDDVASDLEILMPPNRQPVEKAANEIWQYYHHVTGKWHDEQPSVIAKYKTFEDYDKAGKAQNIKSRIKTTPLPSKADSIEERKTAEEILNIAAGFNATDLCVVPGFRTVSYKAAIQAMHAYATQQEAIMKQEYVKVSEVEAIINEKISSLTKSSLLFDSIKQTQFPNCFKPIISTLNGLLTQLRNKQQ